MLVRDIFKLNKNLEKLKVLAGETGLNNRIGSVEIMEVPDGVYWANENDFMISTGYCVAKGEISLEYIIDYLIERKASGFCIKLGRFIDEVPKNIIEKANASNFPILSAPNTLPYSEIMKPIIDNMDDNKLKLYESFQFNSFISELNLLTSGPYYFNSLHELMSKYINHDIRYYVIKDDLGINNKTNLDNESKENQEIINFFKFKSKNLFKYDDEYCFVTPLRSSLYEIGYIIVKSKNTINDVERRIISTVSPYLSIEILTGIINNNPDYLDANQFYTDILKGKYKNSDIEAEKNIKLFEISDNIKRRIIVFNSNFSTLSKSNIFNILKNHFNSKNSSVEYLTILGDKLIMLLQYKKNHNEEIEKKSIEACTNILSDLNTNSTSLKLGISQYCKSFKKLNFALDEALFCLLIGEKLSPDDHIYYYEKYSIYHLLNSLESKNILDKMYENIIIRLKKYDKENNTNLYETLKKLVANDYLIGKTSKELFIHRNTLYNRIKIIEEILDLNINNVDNKLLISLGFKSEKII